MEKFNITNKEKVRKEIEKPENSEEAFIYSFELSPEQRRILRNYLSDLRNKSNSLRFQTRPVDLLPSEIYKSEYIKNIVKERFYETVTKKEDRYSIGDWTDIMETFGIEEDFFKQKDFDIYRKNEWLERIEYGERIKDPLRYKRDWNGEVEELENKEEEKSKKEEEFRYGEFEKCGLNIDNPEVKKAALQGIVSNIFKQFGHWSHEEVCEENIEEYKKLFKISEKEFENSVIDELEGDEHIIKFEQNDSLRKKYSFIDVFLNSTEAKEIAKQIVIQNMTQNHNYDNSKIMAYFGISDNELDLGKIKEIEKLNAINSLNKKLIARKGDEHYLFFDIEHAKEFLSKEDWQKFFSENQKSESLIIGLAYGLHYAHNLDKSISLYQKIGVPDTMLKKAAVSEITIVLSKESFNKEEIENIKVKTGLSDEEFKEALTLGSIKKISRGHNNHEVERLQNDFNLKEMANSSEIQKRLKEIYLRKIEEANTHDLEFIDKKFNIKWKLEERNARKEAVKKMLMSRFIIDNFHSFGQIRHFIEDYYPERYKLDLIFDSQIKKTIQKSLVDIASHYDVLHKDTKIVNETANFFNLSKDDIIKEIQKKISDGYFISNEKEKYNIKNFFPEIDIDGENRKCLENHGIEIVIKDFESKNWKELNQIKKLQNQKTDEEIKKTLNAQEKILIDDGKSPELKNYAIEALLNVKKGALEDLLDSRKEEIDGSENGEILFRLRQVIQKVPQELLTNNWTYFFNKLKNLTEEEFLIEIAIIEKLYSKRETWWLRDRSFEKTFEQLLSYTSDQRREFFENLELSGKQVTNFNNNEWARAIVSYVSSAEEENRLQINGENKVKIIELFNGEYKDVALNGIQKELISFLKNTNAQFLSPELFFVSKSIDDAGGAGNLKHIESLGNLICQYNHVYENPQTTQETKNELRKLFFTEEKRIEQEKWSQDDRSEFYNLSKDIIEAAPSLFTSFSPLLEQFSPKDMKIFLKEIFPLYQAELVIIQKLMGREGEVAYNPRDLVLIRKAIQNLTKEIKNKPEEKIELLRIEKERILEILKTGFRDRFGVTKIPPEFSKENIRSIQNCIRYMGNISNRNLQTEAIISFYLGLEVNNEWVKFRQGQDIKAETYLSGKQLEIIKPLLEEKMKMNIMPIEIAGIPKEKVEIFHELLQEDVSSSMIGNIQTVDIKLGNIKRNAEELADPDIFQDKTEKKIINLLLEEKKLVGTVLAKTYGEVSGKKIEMNDEEKKVQIKIASIFGINSWNADLVKNIQDKIQPFNLITNMINKMDEEKVEENIVELQKRLVPKDKIVEIFRRLGEDFKQESGALALSKDISYLESLIVKDDKKITSEEKIVVEEYLNSIREKMKELEIMLEKIKEYFEKIKKSLHLSNHELLKNRLFDLEKVIYSKDSNTMIISRMTKDLNLVIENMRQCLGCLRKEANNDTNLAFGDYNKFFLINQSEKDKGSISDEILFFLPIKKLDGGQEMSFVMDRVYGSKLPDVLIGNILSVYKKYQSIKKEIPEAQISISVTREAILSVGFDINLLEKRLKEVLPEIRITEQIDGLIADVSKSSFSDNYIEFGKGGARQVGERIFSGLVIK